MQHNRAAEILQTVQIFLFQLVVTPAGLINLKIVSMYRSLLGYRLDQ